MIETLTRFSSEGPAICIDIFPDVIFLRQVKQFPDLWCPLWTSHSWLLSVSQTRQIIFSFFHNNQVQNREVLTDDASSNRLPSPLSIPPAISTEARSTCQTNQFCLSTDIFTQYDHLIKMCNEFGIYIADITSAYTRMAQVLYIYTCTDKRTSMKQ